MNYPNDNVNLVEQACQGDEQAFGRLADHHYRTVYGVAFSAVGNWSAAQDIAQETFLLAWSRRDSLRNALAFPAWIRRIAANLAKNWIRSADYRRRLAAHYQAVTPPEAPPHSEPDAQTSANQRRDEVWRALETLPNNLREAIVLYYLHGESMRGVAGALGITENAAQKRLEYGRTKLRAHFEERWKAEMVRARGAIVSHSAKDRFLAGLVLGPAVPGLGKTAAATGFGLWWEVTKQSALAQKALTGVAVMTAKKSVVVGIASLLLIAGVCWMALPGAARRPAAVTGAAAPQAATPAPPVRSVAKSAQPVSATPDLAQAAGGLAPKPAELAKPNTAPASLSKIVITPTEIPDPKDYAWVQGIVVDETGAPYAGAQVDVAALGLSKPSKDESPERMSARQDAYLRFLGQRTHYWSGVTDAAGNFLISGIRYAGLALVSAQAPDHAAAMTSVNLAPASAPEDITLKLQPGVTIHGKVLSAAGKPAVGAVLRIIGLVSQSGAQGGTGVVTITRDNGEFDLGVSEAGTMSLTCDSPVLGSTTFKNTAADPDQELVLTYPPGAILFGRVNDDQKKPVANVEVRLTGSVTTQGQSPDGSSSGASAISAVSVVSATTDAQGAYRFDQVDAGQQYLTGVFAADGAKMSDGPLLADLKAGEERELNFSVRPLMAVKGTVYAQKSGRPIPGVTITSIIVKSLQPTPDQIGPSPARSAEDGSYTVNISGAGGTFKLIPSFPAVNWGPNGPELGMSDPKTVDLKPGDALTVDFHIPDPVTRAFLVTDDADAPLEGARITIQQRSGVSTSGYSSAQATGPDGRITLAALPPQVETTIIFNKPGFLAGKSAALIAQPGDVIAEEPVVMYRGGSIVATLLGPDGAPIADQKVVALVQYGGQREMTLPGRTNGDGIMTLGDMPATQVALQFTVTLKRDGVESALSGAVDSATIAAGETTDLGRVPLTPVGKGK